MSVVGDRYAESLFDLAKEENKVTQYLDDIKLVGEVLDSDPQIVQFFNHVLIENDKKIQLLDQSFKGNVDQYVLNFFLCLFNFSSCFFVCLVNNLLFHFLTIIFCLIKNFTIFAGSFTCFFFSCF